MMGINITSKKELVQNLLGYIPKNHLSYLFGKLADAPLPKLLSQKSVEAFAKFYNLNMSEAEFAIDEYKTIEALFTRRLKPGVRPIESDLVHPCDARITEAGLANDGVLIQAKGKSYTLEELIRNDDLARIFVGGTYLTYYLCPTDYHRVHFPVTGRVVQSVHIPGTLWPVNDWSVRNVPNLFTVNERMVTLLETAHGRVGVVMVGATNVGKMTASFDPQLLTNDVRAGSSVKLRRYEPSLPVQCGDELGIFHLGSTVILLFEKERVQVDLQHVRGPVKLGKKLGEWK